MEHSDALWNIDNSDIHNDTEIKPIAGRHEMKFISKSASKFYVHLSGRNDSLSLEVEEDSIDLILCRSKEAVVVRQTEEECYCSQH